MHAEAGPIGMVLEWHTEPHRCVVTEIMEHAQERINHEVAVGDKLLEWDGASSLLPATIARIHAHARNARSPRVHLSFERTLAGGGG